MTRLWQLQSSSRLNSVTVEKSGARLCQDSNGNDTGAIGTIRQLLKIAAYERFHWISANGYNAISVQRSHREIVYTVRAHFGMRAYELLRIDPIDPAKPKAERPAPKSMSPRLQDYTTRRLKEEISGIYRRAASEFYDLERIRNLLAVRVWNAERIEQLSAYRRAFLRGYAEALYTAHFSLLKPRHSLDGNWLADNADLSGLWPSVKTFYVYKANPDKIAY